MTRFPSPAHRRRGEGGVRLGASALCILVLACGVPRDPEGTLDRARSGILRVGVTERPPWVVAGGTSPRGVEPDLIEDFAASIGAPVQWHWGATEDNLAALEEGELDLVAGGLEEGSPWMRRVGFTRPYLTISVRVGVASGSPPSAIDGLPVAVEEGSELAALVELHDGVARRVVDPWGAGTPVAAPQWELEARGWSFDPDLVLDERRHVLAVPPGENGFLVALERSVLGRERELRDALAGSRAAAGSRSHR